MPFFKNKKVYAWGNCLGKHFKKIHIFGIGYRLFVVKNYLYHCHFKQLRIFNNPKMLKVKNVGKKWFYYSKNVTNFEPFFPDNFISHKPLISEEWYTVYISSTKGLKFNPMVEQSELRLRANNHNTNFLVISSKLPFSHIFVCRYGTRWQIWKKKLSIFLSILVVGRFEVVVTVMINIYICILLWYAASANSL